MKINFPSKSFSLKLGLVGGKCVLKEEVADFSVNLHSEIYPDIPEMKTFRYDFKMLNFFSKKYFTHSKSRKYCLDNSET